MMIKNFCTLHNSIQIDKSRAAVAVGGEQHSHGARIVGAHTSLMASVPTSEELDPLKLAS